MEMNLSLLLDDAADGCQGSRSKSKTVLNRRPSGYWKVFSNWWRGRFSALKTRPTVHEVIEWYNKNAATSWTAGQVPGLKAVLRQSKGLRPIDGLKEYFREYRKKRKQQGGQALTAADDTPARRSRPSKRRRARAARDESSDEEEVEEEMAMEHETSTISDLADNAAASEDVDMACDDAAAAESPDACVPMAAVAASAPAPLESGLTPAHAFALLGGWTSAGVEAMVCPMAADCDVAPPLAFIAPGEEADASSPVATFGSTEPLSLQSPFMPLSLAHTAAAAAPGDAVHPAVALGMVPIADRCSPRLPDLTSASAPHPEPYGSMTASPFIVLAAVSVSRAPPRLTARTCRAAAASLPPLTAMAAVPAIKQEPAAVLQQQPEDDDPAGDRCSTGGGAPAGGHCARPYPHHPMFEGAPPPHAYYAPYGQPPSHHHHGACTCHVHHHAYGAYRAASCPMPRAGCSGGGASSSTFSPVAPWPLVAEGSHHHAAYYPPPPPHHPAWSWYGPEPSCPFPCCGVPPPPACHGGPSCRCAQSPLPSPPHAPYGAWHGPGPHHAFSCPELLESMPSPAAHPCGGEKTSEVEASSSCVSEHQPSAYPAGRDLQAPPHSSCSGADAQASQHQHQHMAAMMAMMHHRHLHFTHPPHPHHLHRPYPHVAPYSAWSHCPSSGAAAAVATSDPACGMVAVASTNSMASLDADSSAFGALPESSHLQRNSWPFAHGQQEPHHPQPHAPAAPSPEPEAAAAVGEAEAEKPVFEGMPVLQGMDSLGACVREALDHDLGMAWESFLKDDDLDLAAEGVLLCV